MTYCDEIATLDEYNDEDIGDIIVKLEKSFGLEFKQDAFQHVNTFGDLCDVFKSYMSHEHFDDCTKQQAFYRVRKAISVTQGIAEDGIKLDALLSDLFPEKNRRKKVKEFKNCLKTETRLLTYPDRIALALVIVFLLSLLAFFYDWKIALSGLVFFYLFMKIADHYANDFTVQTVRDLTEKLSRENYIDIRRKKGTVNKKEVLEIITDTFSTDLDIDKSNLTRDAKFRWAK
ncbi:hypothetical protein [Longitalea arenae]|uniref:hypothetical protein n=1 Tax=Longitalea arenae TaxID=2812558 RepID=UPI0019677A95|nr:hypothetical protein [Longitalea arenae]